MTNQLQELLEQNHDDLDTMVKLMDVAEHEAMLKLQQRKENRFYYKKFKSESSKRKAVDPDMGCAESFPVESHKTYTQKGLDQRVTLAVQETTIIQETARRIRFMAQELAKKRAK